MNYFELHPVTSHNRNELPSRSPNNHASGLKEKEQNILHHGDETSDECCRRQRVQSPRWTVSGWEAGASEPTGRPGSLPPPRTKVSCTTLCMACFTLFAIPFCVNLNNISTGDTGFLGYDVMLTGKYLLMTFRKIFVAPSSGSDQSKTM